MRDTNNEDVVHISPGLVKLLAGSIMASLIAIAGYMLIWNRDDAAFKREVIVQMLSIHDQIAEVKDTISAVPANTQRISNLEDHLMDQSRRIEKLEDR